MKFVPKVLQGLFVCLLCFTGMHAHAAYDEDDDDPDLKRWKESELVLPTYPEDRNLIEFDVGPTNVNHFFVDGQSITVSTDGIVRYTLVVRTAGGANNVSFEGMRCETREMKVYATGRADRTWRKPAVAEWRPVENRMINQHHMTLLRQYFCASGIIRNGDEGRYFLKRGGNPAAQ